MQTSVQTYWELVKQQPSFRHCSWGGNQRNKSIILHR